MATALHYTKKPDFVNSRGQGLIWLEELYESGSSIETLLELHTKGDTEGDGLHIDNLSYA